MMTKKDRSEKAADANSTATELQKIVVLGVAAKEGWELLTPGQYQHVKDLEKQLVGFGKREFDSNLSIKQFGDFWELREKGGVLGRINLRVYFKFHEEANAIVILHTYKKEDDGAAPKHVMIRVRNRWNRYRDGFFDANLITYVRDQ